MWGAYLDTGPSPHLGDTADTETVTLTPANMPAHNHTMNFVAAGVVQEETDQPANNWLSRLVQKPASGAPTAGVYKAYLAYDASKTLTALNPNSISAAGQGAAHENRQPFLAMNFCISLAGAWPPRPE